MAVSDYSDLIVWQKSMDLVTEVYRIVNRLPKSELYALSDQMRRAVISIPSNIAEGHGRNSTKEFVNFLSIAKGSQCELETQILICIRLGYLQEDDAGRALSLCEEVNKMINSIIKKLRLKG